jgi:LPS-assembly lipoprotein
MLLSRFCCAVVMVATLAACGFQPLYYRDGERTSIRGDMSSVYVSPIEDGIGQELRNNLNDAFNPTGVQGVKVWNLDITLTESTEMISLESTSFSTRANLIVSASITLTPVEAESVDTESGSIRAISSYNIIESDYADIVAERDARSRAVVSLSSDIRRQVAMWLRGAEE